MLLSGGGVTSTGRPWRSPPIRSTGFILADMLFRANATLFPSAFRLAVVMVTVVSVRCYKLRFFASGRDLGSGIALMVEPPPRSRPPSSLRGIRCDRPGHTRPQRGDKPPGACGTRPGLERYSGRLPCLVYGRPCVEARHGHGSQF